MRNLVLAKKFWCWVLIAAFGACVEPIQFDVPTAALPLVVEGFISDDLPPYEVKLSRGIQVEADSIRLQPVTGAQLILIEDGQIQEDFIEKEPGRYLTQGIIRGRLGHTYSIQIKTTSGAQFVSQPEVIRPVGEIEKIRAEFEARTRVEDFGEVSADVFNVLVDAKSASTDDETFVRWRFQGTYKVVTYPEQHYTWEPPYAPYRNPFPCSGYILVGGPEGSGGILQQVGDCSCCTCWVNQVEDKPQISDTQLVANGEFRNLKVGEVPINRATFHDKYRIEVEQMSISRAAFDFFELIRDQKENASSLFQPPFGELRGNISPLNNDDRVVGLFWATAIQRKSIFLYPTDVPYPLVPIEYITYPCDQAYPNATNKKPDEW